MELKDIITDLCVVINQVSESKRNLMRAYKEDMYEHMYLADQVAMLKNELSDTDYDLDRIKDALYELTEALENEVYKQELLALSPFTKGN